MPFGTFGPGRSWTNGQPLDGSPIPDVIQQGIDAGAVAGFVPFQPGNPDAEGLDAFEDGEVVDAQIFITSGVYGIFVPSEVCPWF